MLKGPNSATALVARVLVWGVLWCAGCTPTPQKPIPEEPAAVTTIYVSRHAEKAGTMSNNPPLTEGGKRRALALAERFEGVHLDAVYATQLTRTKQTAQPTATAKGLDVQTWKDTRPRSLAKHLLKKHAGQTVLVVNHSYSMPRLFKTLGIKGRIPEPAYGLLYTVTLQGRQAEAHLTHERYGAPPGS